jgi:hypothetical protein
MCRRDGSELDAVERCWTLRRIASRFIWDAMGVAPLELTRFDDADRSCRGPYLTAADRLENVLDPLGVLAGVCSEIERGGGENSSADESAGVGAMELSSAVEDGEGRSSPVEGETGDGNDVLRSMFGFGNRLDSCLLGRPALRCPKVSRFGVEGSLRSSGDDEIGSS